MGIVIDIETLARPVSQDRMEAQRKKLMQKYKTPSVIDEHLRKWVDKQCFGPFGATPICIGIGFHDAHSGIVGQDYQRMEVACHATDNLDELMKWFIDELTEGYETFGPHIVGFNHISFDLPVLTAALHRVEMRLPMQFEWGKLIDLCEYPWGKNHKMGLKDMSNAFGFQSMLEDEYTGADVARLWAQDKANGTDEVIKYCIDDVRRTAFCYESLSRMYKLGR
jgi:hypothetical protein